jgi:mono/diheme cytochrome c family protein
MLRQRTIFFTAIVAVVFSVVLAQDRAIAFPWSIDMYRGEAVQPLSVAPRVMPKGTVSTEGAEPPMSRIASMRLRNPLPSTPGNIDMGHKLYDMTCAPCHGATGKGNGPVRHVLEIPPANLTGDAVTGMSDGYIYGTIRDGSIVMPGYGDALSPTERWEIVLFVRSLQQSQNATAAK